VSDETTPGERLDLWAVLWAAICALVGGVFFLAGHGVWGFVWLGIAALNLAVAVFIGRTRGRR
jgi:hypothetical protein